MAMKISIFAGLSIILLLLILSVVSLYFSATFPNQIIQIISLLVSMGLVFVSTHPLAHFVVAKIYSARVTNFFIAPSDFRKLPMKTARIFGSMIPTIGTKLDHNSLLKLSNARRARIFGAGAIASTILILIPLSAAIVSHESIIGIIFGGLFFLVNLGTELMFSTKVGDLAKMKQAYSGSSHAH